MNGDLSAIANEKNHAIQGLILAFRKCDSRKFVGRHWCDLNMTNDYSRGAVALWNTSDTVYNYAKYVLHMNIFCP